MRRVYLDTSVVAKWYLREPLSEQVDEFLRGLPYALISWLTTVEMACLLGRRRRSAEISAQIESRVLAAFEQDIADDNLEVVTPADEQVPEALRLIAALPSHPLRTLDALHLAVARRSGVTAIATADHVMAAAADDLGLEVEAFLPGRE